MKGRITKCIDSGSEFCPCKLAESNECVLCTQMQGNIFCDCYNWNGVCIYQEFINNGRKAKEGRKTFKCDVLDYERISNDIIFIKLSVTHKLALDLIHPGSYVFIEPDKNLFYSTPVSIMESNTEMNYISFLLEIKGIKTKKIIDYLNNNNVLMIKGPFWNGVFGIDNLNNQENSNVVIVAKNIGIAPMVPVLRKLNLKNNNITLYIECNDKEYDFINKYLEKYKVKVIRDKLFDSGELSDNLKLNLNNDIEKNIKFIYSAGADIMIKKIIEYLDEKKRKDILLACCNNFTMCCGEGICGACAVRFKGGIVRRFCKEQVDPREIFEGRRYI